jgi:chaperone modulatory protein CbpM
LRDAEFLTQAELIVRVSRLSAERLTCWVDEGLVRAADDREKRFDATDIARLELLCDLADDFDLTTEALGVVCTLLDQVHTLRNQLLSLGKAVDSQPNDVREAIIDALTGTLRGE